MSTWDIVSDIASQQYNSYNGSSIGLPTRKVLSFVKKKLKHDLSLLMPCLDFSKCMHAFAREGREKAPQVHII